MSSADHVSHGSQFFRPAVILSQSHKKPDRYVVFVGATPLKN